MELWSVKQHQEPLWFALILAHATSLKWVPSEIPRKLQLMSTPGRRLKQLLIWWDSFFFIGKRLQPDS